MAVRKGGPDRFALEPARVRQRLLFRSRRRFVFQRAAVRARPLGVFHALRQAVAVGRPIDIC